METFYLKRQDTGPVLTVTLLDPDKAPVSLSGVSKVWLHVLLADGTSVMSRAMEILDDGSTARRGLVRYAWLAGDWGSGSNVLPLAQAVYAMEYETVTLDGYRQSFPNSKDHKLSVYRDIGQGAPA